MHQIQQAQRDLSLELVLRVVRLTVILPSPADEHKQRNCIHLSVGERSQRIHRIAFSAVLHIDKRHLSGSKIMSGGNAYSIAFVRGNHISRAAMCQCIITETIQITVRDTGKEAYTMIGQCLKHFFLI